MIITFGFPWKIKLTMQSYLEIDYFIKTVTIKHFIITTTMEINFIWNQPHKVVFY